MGNVDPIRALPNRWWKALGHRWTWQMAWRDSRTQRQRLIIFSLSMVAGIAALVAIHSLKASLETGIEIQAKALLGSDLQISSRRPFPPETVADLSAQARRMAREIGFSSMLYFPGVDAARLVQVRGLEGEYPFYGKVETAPPEAWVQLRSEPGVLLEAALLDQFGVKVGDKVKLGSLELPILGTVLKPAPRSSRFSGFAPEAYVRLSDLEKTGLLGTTSLAFHSLHLELGGTAGGGTGSTGGNTEKVKTGRQSSSEQTAKALKKQFADSAWKFETPEDRRDSLGKSLDNFQQFLGIIALVALILGAIGVAGAVHAQVSQRVTTIAILRCLGAPGDLAFSVYLAQALALGLLGAGLGALVGMALHFGALVFFRESLPVAIDPAPVWAVVAQTTAAGFAICCGFALLPLLRIRAISPGATLREGASVGGRRGALRAWPVYLFLATLLTLLTVLHSSHWWRAVALTGALAVAFLVLAATAQGLIVAARRLVRPTWPYLLRQGISNLHRPHNQTLLFLLSLGLGTFLLLTILLTRNVLLERVSVAQLNDSPNIYLVDVQPDQLQGVQKLIGSLKLPVLESAPMVTMRIAAVRGVPVRELEKQGQVPKWILQREFRSSYRAQLSSTEKLVAGQWFTQVPDPNGPVPLSLEKDIAKDLKVALGDELELDVQGVPIRARVTSFREVDWSRFNLNFFMIFPPGVLESAPGFEVVTTRIPAGVSSGDLQRALVQQFPNVSAIDLTLILETVRSILEKIGRVISILAGFTVLAGLPIMIGTLLNGRAQRRRESVLLRTLGASARQVRTILVIEYTTLGVLSALSGVLLAMLANYALATFVFEASPWPDWRLLAAAFASTSLLSILGGLALSRGVCDHPPLEILRSNG